VLCGDAGEPAAYRHLLDSATAAMTFTDPPYNVDYANGSEAKGHGTSRAILNDNLGKAFQPFLGAACRNILACTDGAIYICMSSSALDTLQRTFREAGGRWSTFIIWAKHTFTLGRSDYQRQYEPILYGWRQGAERRWCGARDQGDVWTFDKPSRNDLHPTMKPVALAERAIRNSSKPGDVVLDPFGGSGTTLIACQRTGSKGRLIELDPRYVDVIVQRWQALAEVEATLEETGRTFAKVAANRRLAQPEATGNREVKVLQ
jgi:DNA modification methylase